MRFFRQALLGLVLASLALGLLGYAGQMVRSAVSEKMSQEPRVPPARERSFTVNVVPAEPQSIAPILTAFGEVKSRRTLELRMATTGQVVALSENFVEGGEVRAGEVLVRLNDADARSALSRAEADFLDAQAEVAEADRALLLAQDELSAAQVQAQLRVQSLERQADLQTRGVGTAAAVETAELAVSSAEQAVLARRSAVNQAQSRRAQADTRLARMQLAVDDAQRRLDDMQLVAEFDGTLSGVSLVQGGIVGANERLGSLIDPKSIEVEFKISTEQYTRLLDDAGELIETPVRVVLDVLGTDIVSDAVLSRGSGSVADGQTGRTLFATVTEAKGLQPGDFVSVEVTEPELRFVVRLPGTSLNARNQVLALTEDDRLEPIEVALIRRQGDDVLVRSRDLMGREIVTQQTPVLGAGVKVTPLRGSEAREFKEVEMIELSDDRRQKLIAAVEGNTRIPAQAKDRILAQLKEDKVPAEVVNRLESRMGG